MTQSKNTKVLVVDDEADVTDLVSFHLHAKGFRVEAINDPNVVLSRARLFLPDLFILDVMMPDLSGIQLCRLLRADPAFAGIPVIFLTARAEEADRVAGFEVGADDYVCKPFSPRELVLRVQSILRRNREGAAPESKVIEAGGISIDMERHQVKVQGAAVEFTATEFKLLALLVERKGRVQSREQLLTNVWNYDEDMETRTVDTHVRRIREKLGSEADLIETVRGVGYRVTDS